MGQGYFTYILECADNTLYTGWTTDVAKRVEAHNKGKGAKYTRTRGPVRLLASWCFDSKSEAMRWEWFIKRLPRPQKLQLIRDASVSSNAI
jgi:putative endonuclease